MINEYNLVYICKETGKEFKARKLDSNTYSLIDPETSEKKKYSDTVLRRLFKASKDNNKAKSKRHYCRPRMFSARTYTKEFCEYLRSDSVKEIA